MPGQRPREPTLRARLERVGRGAREDPRYVVDDEVVTPVVARQRDAQSPSHLVESDEDVRHQRAIVRASRRRELERSGRAVETLTRAIGGVVRHDVVAARGQFVEQSHESQREPTSGRFGLRRLAVQVPIEEIVQKLDDLVRLPSSRRDRPTPARNRLATKVALHL
jgi:hypothetical protein